VPSVFDDDSMGETGNLPPEAFAEYSEPLEVNDSWISSATREEQHVAMRAWWFQRYEDPARSTPYESNDGGYIYISGGPFHPQEELSARFSRLVGFDVIQALVRELWAEVGDDWAPVDRFGGEFDVEAHERHEPFGQFDWSLDSDYERLKDLAAENRTGTDVLHRHAYIALIAAMETYLWGTTKYWVETDEGVLRNLVTKLQRYSQKPLKLGEIFSRHLGLKDEINEDLKNTVWHRLETVKPLMECAFDAQLPSIKPLLPWIVWRHDLVHRNGRTSSGEIVALTPEHLDRLLRLILEFCIAVETVVNGKWPDETAMISLTLLRRRLARMGDAGKEDPPPPEELF
jgi:hypothetical protein